MTFTTSVLLTQPESVDFYRMRCRGNKRVSPCCGGQRPGWRTGSPAKPRGRLDPLLQHSGRRSGLRWTLSLPAATLRLWTRHCPPPAGCRLTEWGIPGGGGAGGGVVFHINSTQPLKNKWVKHVTPVTVNDLTCRWQGPPVNSIGLKACLCGACHFSRFTTFTHHPKTCMLKLIGDSKLPQGMNVRVNSMCVCLVMDWRPVQDAIPVVRIMDGGERKA